MLNTYATRDKWGGRTGGIGWVGVCQKHILFTLCSLSTVCDMYAVVYGELLLCLTDRILDSKLWLFPNIYSLYTKREGEINSPISFELQTLSWLRYCADDYFRCFIFISFSKGKVACVEHKCVYAYVHKRHIKVYNYVDNMYINDNDINMMKLRGFEQVISTKLRINSNMLYWQNLLYTKLHRIILCCALWSVYICWLHTLLFSLVFFGFSLFTIHCLVFSFQALYLQVWK